MNARHRYARRAAKILPWSQKSGSPCNYRCAACRGIELQRCTACAVRACQKYPESGSGSHIQRHDTATQPRISSTASRVVFVAVKQNKSPSRESRVGLHTAPCSQLGLHRNDPGPRRCANCLTKLKLTVADHYQEIDANPQVAVFPH
jgi:hypothetical protein